jgi:WD40 repeat protein
MVRLWDAMLGEAIGKLLQGHSSLVQSVAFSPDGKCIVSGSRDKSVRLWDATLGEAIGKLLQEHSNATFSVACFLGGKRVVLGQDDNTIQVGHAESKMTTNRSGYTVDSNAPISSLFTDDCILQNDGWMTTPTGDLLFWVPAENRVGFMWSVGVVGADPNQTQVNLLRFASGLEWENCQKSS